MASQANLAAAPTPKAAGRIIGANDRINLAVVGIGGRGRDHIDDFAKLPQCRLTAVCDVNQAGRERGVAQVEKLLGYKPKQFFPIVAPCPTNEPPRRSALPGCRP